MKFGISIFGRSCLKLQTPDEPSSNYHRCKRRIRVLRPFIKKGSVGAELGVFKGSFLDHLLLLEPEILYAVDPWHLAGPTWRWAQGDQSKANALERIRNAFSDEIERGQLVVVVDYSQSFLSSIADQTLDWVYVDSTHSYEQTRLELELSCKKVKQHGIVMGDDYNSDVNHRNHGVYKAVREFVEAGQMSLVVDGEAGQFVAQVL